MPSDDTQFIIESNEELPAVKMEGIRLRGREKTKDCGAHMKMPSTTCQNFTTATVKDGFNGLSRPPELDQKIVRTEILFEDGGAVEIDHIGRKTAETKVGERGRILG
jgi:hypothetical protein